MGIKRGVSLYSFQEEYFLEKLTLEQCIATAASLGAAGIESIAEQMMPGFPNLPDAFYGQWHEWMEQYGTTATAHDMFLDTKRYKWRELTYDEMVESVRRDIDHAARLGCNVIRMIIITPPAIVEACAPYARDLGLKLAVEVHSPHDLDSDWIQQHLEVAERVGADAVGIIPDFGIFTRRFPRVVTERAVRDGAHRELAQLVAETYDSKGDVAGLVEEVRRRGGNEVDANLAGWAVRFIDSDPKRMLDYMPYIHHIHAKFWEMTDDGVEYSIPYDEAVGVLQEGGYEGYLSSEYEGNRHIQDAFEVDSVEQVRRQHQMFVRLLGERS